VKEKQEEEQQEKRNVCICVCVCVSVCLWGVEKGVALLDKNTCEATASNIVDTHGSIENWLTEKSRN
jgi:hypothetical protein